jgi:ATP synthase protein I
MSGGGASSGQGEDVVWSVLGTLLAGPLVWGGAGWLLGQVLGAVWLVPCGIVLGSIASLYVVYVRHGRADPAANRGDRR